MNNNLCWFYIVIGDSGFVRPRDNNVYINATGVTDIKIIQDEIFKLYKERAQQGFKVASEIIFLVGSITDSDRANEIIKLLRLNGRIEVMKKEEVKVEESVEVKVNNPSIEAILNEEVVDSKQVVEEEEVKVSKQPDNVYKRDFESTNYSGYIGSPLEKKDKFGKAPVIIFIISLLLFISSIILLFVM